MGLCPLLAQAQALTPLPPVNEIHTHWALFSQSPAPQVTVTGLPEPAGDDIVFTITGLEAYGIAPYAVTSYTYNEADQAWAPSTEPLPEAAEPTGPVTLRMGAQYYYMNGFPEWLCGGAEPVKALRLEDYSGDPNNPDYHLSLAIGDGMVILSLAGDGSALTVRNEEAMIYCIYSGDGQLEMGTYMTNQGKDVALSYVIAPKTDAAGQVTYPLDSIRVVTRSGENALWTDGHWINGQGEEVAAPEGVIAEALPFVVVE